MKTDTARRVVPRSRARHHVRLTGLTWGGGLTDGLAFVRTLPAIDLGGWR
jgi:hypothetical protein